MPVTATRAERLRHRCLVVGLALLLGGCNGSLSPRYYWQAAQGQFELWRLARPLAEVDADGASPQALRDKLALAAEIRD